MPRNKFPPPPSDNVDERIHRRQIALALQGVMAGKTNNMGVVTLAVAPATTTLISSPRITGDTVALLVPITANASVALLAGIWQTAAAGAITLTHAAAAAADQTFVFILIG